MNRLSDHIPIGVFVIDAEHRIRHWNSWLEEKTSISETAAVGHTLGDLFPNLNSARFLWGVEQVVSRQIPQILSQALNRFLIPIPIQYTGRHGVSMMQQHVHIEPYQDGGDDPCAVVSVIDVTENVIRSSALSELAHKLRQDSNRDPLTGLFNRRFLWEWLVQQLKQSARYQYPLSCLMFDLDHFKHLNDSFGHDRGDEILKDISAVILSELRESDILVRYGGEEFVTLLPYCDLNSGILSARRILGKINQSSIAALDAGDVTCSIGVASHLPDNPLTGEELLKQADKCLYKAKNLGRNTVAPAQPGQDCDENPPE